MVWCRIPTVLVISVVSANPAVGDSLNEAVRVLFVFFEVFEISVIFVKGFNGMQAMRFGKTIGVSNTRIEVKRG